MSLFYILTAIFMVIVIGVGIVMLVKTRRSTAQHDSQSKANTLGNSGNGASEPIEGVVMDSENIKE